MPYTPITPLPDAPNRTQAPAVFSANTDAFLTALPPLVTQVNAAGEFMEASETSASASANSALESSSAAAAAANYKGEWSALTGALNIPASVIHSGEIWVLKASLANVTLSEPGVTGDWLQFSANASANTVIPQTGGGTLTALRINELRDGNTGYLLPLANSVLVNQTITITLPDEFSALSPVVTRSGADTITGSGGVDTSITFLGSTRISLTSDGVSNWGI